MPLSGMVCQPWACTHDRLPTKWMRLGSIDLLKFWEISDNISEMVRDRDILAMED